jgi:hypothetical protein
MILEISLSRRPTIKSYLKLEWADDQKLNYTWNSLTLDQEWANDKN